MGGGILFCTGGVGNVGTDGTLEGGIKSGGGAGVLSLSRRLSGLLGIIKGGSSIGSAGVSTGATGATGSLTGDGSDS